MKILSQGQQHTGARVWTWPGRSLIRSQSLAVLRVTLLPAAGSAAMNGGEGPAVHLNRREPESWPWKRCRASYLASVGNLCERCLKAGLIVPADQVHHKTKLTPENLNDPAITLNWDNLMALCSDCHHEIHAKVNERRYRIDEEGHVTL